MNAHLDYQLKLTALEDEFEILHRDLKNFLDMVYSFIDSKEEIKNMLKEKMVEKFGKGDKRYEELIVNEFNLLFAIDSVIDSSFDFLKSEADKIRRTFRISVNSRIIKDLETLELMLENTVLLQNFMLSDNLSDIILRAKDLLRDYETQEAHIHSNNAFELAEFLTETYVKSLLSTILDVKNKLTDNDESPRDFISRVLDVNLE